MCFLQNEQDSINADIGEEIITMLSIWLRNSSASKKRLKMKTPQTKPRSGVKTSAMQRRDSDSDGQTESEGEQDVDFKNKIKQLIAESKRRSTTTQEAENEDHVYQRLLS